MLLTIAIIGRPNTGKSTLFNRLAGKKLALVDDTPGVTRDRRTGLGHLYDLTFNIIDTAGYESGSSDTLEEKMKDQTRVAIREANMIFFIVDGKSGLLPEDKNLATIIRRSGKPVVILVNKADVRGAEERVLDAWELGFGEPIAVSAEHGSGLADLHDAMALAVADNSSLSQYGFQIEEDEGFFNHDLENDEENTLLGKEKPLRIAVAGQPNAGKSTLINALLGEERLLAGPESGMTRDAISIEWNWEGRDIKLFDTAGIRKKAKVQEKLEKLAVGDALRAIFFAEIVIIVMDSTVPFEKQNLQIANLVIREGRAPVIAFSKCDLILEKEDMLCQLREKTARVLPQAVGIPVVMVSAQKAEGLENLMHAVFSAEKIWNRRLPTGPLNRWLEKVVLRHPPPAVSGHRSRIKYITQVKTRPPSFVVYCTRPDQIPSSYIRHIINGLREAFALPGVVLRIFLRSSENPFQKNAERKNQSGK